MFIRLAVHLFTPPLGVLSKWISKINLLIIIWIHTSHQPHLIWISPIQLWITWTNQIIWIWFIRLNITHTSYLMTNTFKIISTFHRVDGDSSPLSQIFNHLVHNFHNFHHFRNILPRLCSYTSFLEPSIEKKSELEKSIEAVQGMLEFQQNKFDSPCQPQLQDSYSSFPVVRIEKLKICTVKFSWINERLQQF